MYYIINTNTGQIMDGLEHPPFQSELQDLSDEMNCPVYIIQGQHFGMNAEPSQSNERQTA